MKHRQITADGIRLLIDRFHDRVRADPEIAPRLNDAIEDWDEHVERLHAFWSAVMLAGGADKLAAPLDGPPFAIEAPFFEHWIAVFDEEAGEIFDEPVAAVFRSKAHRVAEAMKNALFYRPGMVKTACRSIGRASSAAGAAPAGKRDRSGTP